MANVISFVNQKGGVGKTTNVREISYIFAKMFGKKVLMMDLDSQCNLTKISGVDVTKMNQEKITTYDVLKMNTRIKDAIVEVGDNLFLIPGSRRMLSQDFTQSDDVMLLSELIDIIKDENFDYIMLDCGPAAGNVQTMVLLASDNVVCCSAKDPNAFEGAIQLFGDCRKLEDTYKKYHAKLAGMIFTRADKSNACKIMIEDNQKLADTVGIPFFPPIKFGTVVDEIKIMHNALNEYKPGSEQARAYYEIAKHLLNSTKGE